MGSEDLVSVVSPQSGVARQRHSLAAQPVHHGGQRIACPGVRGGGEVAARASEPQAVDPELTVSRETSHHVADTKRCPCASCRRVKARSVKRWKLRVARGETIWGDIERVRAHVASLRDRGMGLKTIAHNADVSTSAISHLFYDFAYQPRSRRVTAPVAEKLLAVRFDVRRMPPKATVDSTGARRRLQALLVAGWTVPVLADRMGITRQEMRRYLVYERYAAGMCVRVLDLFERLWPERPPAITEYAAARTRIAIARNGWVGLGAWDDEAIDDPTATPRVRAEEPVVDDVLVNRVLNEQARFRVLSSLERVELARRWRERGGTVTSFATLIGRSGEVAQRYFAEVDTPPAGPADEQRKSA